MYSDDLDSVTNNLRDSAKGSLVSYDDIFPLTGYEPTTRSSSTTRSSTTRSPASSLTPRIPSSTLFRHQTRTSTTLRSASYSLKYTENTPITAVRKVYMSVRRQCLSWSIERGNLWKRVTSISFVCVRNMYSAHNQFPAITQTERMVDRTEKPVEEITGIAEERESSSAQIRTLFDNKDERSSQNVAKKFLITNS